MGRSRYPDDRDGLRFCGGCREWKLRDVFQMKRMGQAGLGRRCPACVLEASRVARAKYRAAYQGPRCETKVCPGCGEQKAASHFRPAPGHASGLRIRCKECESADRRLKTYGVSRDQLIEMFLQQGGVCAICRVPLDLVVPRAERSQRKQAHVDHDHETKRVRGLLCYTCNDGLGKFKDDVALFERAVEYLNKSREQSASTNVVPFKKENL